MFRETCRTFYFSAHWGFFSVTSKLSSRPFLELLWRNRCSCRELVVKQYPWDAWVHAGNREDHIRRYKNIWGFVSWYNCCGIETERISLCGAVVFDRIHAYFMVKLRVIWFTIMWAHSADGSVLLPCRLVHHELLYRFFLFFMWLLIKLLDSRSDHDALFIFRKLFLAAVESIPI